MNLDKFKPAWNQYRLMNSLSAVTDDEVLRIIGTPHNRRVTIFRMIRHTAMYSFLILCCQGC